LDETKATNEPKETQAQQDIYVSVQVPNFPTEYMPSMSNDSDSVSTFHHGTTINLTNTVSDDEATNQTTSKKSPVSILKTSRLQESDVISRISTSDSATKISSLETEISMMGKHFKDEIGKLQTQAAKQADTQLAQSSMLSEILFTLKKINLSTLIEDQSQKRSEVVNLPQTAEAGGSPGVAGHG
jgi:hypothetical protein